MLKQQRADHVRHRLQELYPETPIPLDHTDPYTLLVAVLLSAQCTDVRVNQVTPALFRLADNPADMMKVPVEQIQAIIRPCGLSPRKSAAISQLSRILMEKHGLSEREAFYRIQTQSTALGKPSHEIARAIITASELAG
ncbi:MAG: ANTAR domain-containing protein [Verrucomicrobiaceae bacterium]|nr:MAG: ANTAR domain-containing protein [Verrucomicrobiaceae bacterium]